MVQKRKDDLSLEPLSFEQWRLNNADSNSESASDVKSKSYRRVTIQGKFDHTNSILVGPRGPPPGALATTGPNSGMGGGGGMSSSMQGYWVVTPLIVNDEIQTNNDDCKEVDSLSEDVSSNEGQKKGWLGRLLPWRRRNNNTCSASDQKLNGLESSSSADSATGTSSSSNEKPTTVWINRGWIPRHYINQNTNQILQSWDEPNEHVTVLSMESQTEKGGGMFTPPSRIDAVGKGGGNLIGASSDKKCVRKLLWMDREAMEEMTNCIDDHPSLFVQINTTADDMKNEPKSFPVQPSDEYVGEFKVTPDVHMGYASWSILAWDWTTFLLSAARFRHLYSLRLCHLVLIIILSPKLLSSSDDSLLLSSSLGLVSLEAVDLAAYICFAGDALLFFLKLRSSADIMAVQQKMCINRC
eukprot:scaffold13671_cov72-Skeletonema_dohrnii-CCMP3373.AAC.4